MDHAKPWQTADDRPIARISYAQNMEDILLDRLFGGRPGTFMDVGANHPFLDSNTYFFYLRGWRGVNLEPIPHNHALFLEHRPGDLNLDVAASDFEGDLTFHEIATDEGLTGHSSLSAEVADQHRGGGFSIASYQVRARTVAALVAEHRIEPPDFLSLDVEGHEDAVLRGIPWKTWRPRALVIEALSPLSHEVSYGAWEPTLLANGYLFAATNGVNRFYLRDDLRDKLPLFQTPVNCLDQYQRAEVVAARGEVEGLNGAVQYLQRQYDQIVADRDWDRANFERIREGWTWGQAQAEHAQHAWERDRAAYERDRAAYEHHRAESDRAAVASEADRAALHALRIEFEHTREEFHRCWAAREWERADLQARQEAARHQEDALREENESLRRQLLATQRGLRPYRLLDRLGLVPRGYGMARRVKGRLTP